MPNVRASSGMMGTISLPSSGIFISVLRTLTKAAVVDASRPREPSSASLNISSGGALISMGFTLRAGSGPPMRFDALAQIAHFRRILGRAEEIEVRDGFVGKRNLEAVANLEQIGFANLLLLMRGHAAFGGFAQAVAFDGLGQNHGGLAVVLHRALVGVVDLDRIVAAAAQRPDLSSVMCSTSLSSSGYLPKNSLRM